MTQNGCKTTVECLKEVLTWFLYLFLLKKSGLILTALHGMQTRYSDEKVVRPSVCPSARQTREL